MLMFRWGHAVIKQSCYSRNIAPLAHDDWTMNLVKLIG